MGSCEQLLQDLVDAINENTGVLEENKALLEAIANSQGGSESELVKLNEMLEGI